MHKAAQATLMLHVFETVRAVSVKTKLILHIIIKGKSRYEGQETNMWATEDIFNHLQSVVIYLYNHCPAGCQDSSALVKERIVEKSVSPSVPAHNKKK